MATRDDQKRLVKLARLGKLDGDDGFRQKLAELVKCGFVGEDLDYNEKPYFRSALWEASWKNFETIVRLLVDKRADLQFADFQKRTPLHEAAYYGHMNLVTYFLDNGHPIDPKDDFGQTPLFRAIEGNRMDVTKYLLEKKAEPNLLDTDNVTIQHIAGFKGLSHNSEWLLYRGAWKNRFSVEEVNPEQPPFHEWMIGTYPTQAELPSYLKATPAAPAAPAASASSDVFITESQKESAPAAAAPPAAPPAATKPP